jgi:hypothetical protein
MLSVKRMLASIRAWDKKRIEWKKKAKKNKASKR